MHVNFSLVYTSQPGSFFPVRVCSGYRKTLNIPEHVQHDDDDDDYVDVLIFSRGHDLMILFIHITESCLCVIGIK